MNQRQQQIYEILKNSNKWIKGNELASVFYVTPRTIRSDINKINQEHMEEIISSHSHFGYKINVQQLGNIQISKENEEIPETPLQRAKFLLKELLLSKHSLNLVLLQETLCTSLSTLEKDVRKIRTILDSHPSLTLVKKGDTISLQGEEYNKRKLYKELLSKEVSDNFLNMNKLARLYKSFDFIHISNILEDKIKEFNYSIREVSISIVMVHIGIAIDRILQRKYVKDVELKNNIEDTVEYAIANTFYIQVKRELNMEVPKEEIQLLALLLLGKQSHIYQDDEVLIHNQKISIEDTMVQMLNQIERMFDIKLVSDDELKSGLGTHLQSYANRLEAKENIKNIFLPEIKKQYPLVFEMGIIAARELGKLWKIHVSEDEIGFLSIHLGSAYDRLSKERKIRAVLIYPHEASFSHICETKINTRFSQQLEIVKSFSLFDEQKIEEYDTDLILTTIPIEHNLSIPTLQISLFLTMEDESLIFQLLNDITNKASYLTSISRLEEIIKPEFFFTDLEASTPEEVIKIISKKATLKGIVPIGFYEDVMKRESMSSTSFIHGFATPHAMNLSAFESMISVVFLKKPIPWGDYQVQLIFYLAIKEGEQNILRFFFDWFSKIMDNQKIMHQLMNIKDYDTFMEKVIHMEGKYE